MSVQARKLRLTAKSVKIFGKTATHDTAVCIEQCRWKQHEKTRTEETHFPAVDRNMFDEAKVT
jgi:hypothetical protein